MRILIAGLLGGLVLFVWGFLFHAVLPLGNVGMQAPTDEDPVLAAMQANFDRPGLYFLPYLSPEAWSDEAARSAWEDKTRRVPYALVVYHPEGAGQAEMGPNMAIQWTAMTLAALFMAWLLSLSRWSFGRRVGVATLLGGFAWLNVNVPWWNWYKFPLDHTLACLAEQTVGWLGAGLVIAWWLGRGEARG